MSFPELLEAARRLSRTEQLRLVHELVSQSALTPEERLAAVHGLIPGATYDVWFPDPNGPAVAAALQALRQERAAE